MRSDPGRRHENRIDFHVTWYETTLIGQRQIITERDPITIRHVACSKPPFEQVVPDQKYTDIKELAAAEGITRPSYASRILRLVLLAPDVQESILDGEQPAALTLSQLMDGAGLVW